MSKWIEFKDAFYDISNILNVEKLGEVYMIVHALAGSETYNLDSVEDRDLFYDLIKEKLE